MKVGGSLCVVLPIEWVRRLKETPGLSHRVIGVEWSPASPEIRLRALAVEELERGSVREEESEASMDSTVGVSGTDRVGEANISAGGSQH